MLSKEYIPRTETPPAIIEDIRVGINTVETLLTSSLAPSRQLSIALTHLETAGMFAIKAAAMQLAGK